MESHPEFLGYGSVQDLVYGSGRRFIRYVLFRFVPPTLVGVLACGVMNRLEPGASSLPALLVLTVAGNTSGSLARLFGRSTWLRERLAHLFVMKALLLVAGATSLLLDGTEIIGKVTPSWSGFIDNAWSTLLISVAVAYFILVTQHAPAVNPPPQTGRESAFLYQAYRGIQERFGYVIEQVPLQEGTVREVLPAILTYENLNRPKWWRKAENVLVKLPGVELTVGIAQVKSSRPLTDEESVQLAAARLDDALASAAPSDQSEGDYDLVKRIIRTHNSNESYVREVFDLWMQTVGLRPQQ